MRERLRSSRTALRVRGLHMFSSARERVLSSAVRPFFVSSTVVRFRVRSRVGRAGISNSCGCASLPDSETASTVGSATWDWWRLDLGRGLMRGWTRVTEDMNVPDLERGLGEDDFEAGLRAELGEASTFAFAFVLALSFFLMLALRSPLKTDTLRLRLRP